VAIGAVSALALLTGRSFAADAPTAVNHQIDVLQDQIRQQQEMLVQQQKQLQTQQQQLQDLLARVADGETQSKRAQAVTPASAPVPSQQAPTPSAKLELSDKNRPTFTSADGRNSIGLSSIFNLDVGGYNYRPNSGATTPQSLQNGVNARRARIGVNGTFQGDWKYDLQYDFGNYDDGLTATNSTKSGVKSAFISYGGINATMVDFGYLSVPYTLDQATANVDYMFLEHPIPQALAIAVAGGDSRSAFGTRSFDDRYWVGGYLTGPKAGTSHTAAEQLGGTVRGTYQVVSTDNSSLHVGGDFSQLIKAPGTHTLNFAIEPEISIDPTATYGLTLGSAANPLRSASVYSLEAAGGYQSLFFQGEYFFYNFDRKGLASARFNGGYLQGSWTVTGEHRAYSADSGAYGRIYPNQPFSLKEGGAGAWELAARLSQTNLNDHYIVGAQNSLSAVDGGNEVTTTLGVNWYPNNNIMFRLNYEHGVFGDLASNITAKPSTQKDVGAHLNAVAARAQVTF
jgi:phosphate-selective porin OprO/OprP